jgi:hypothetical protein
VPAKIPRKTSGVAGASGGTGLIGLAEFIPDTHPTIKHIVVYISPTASVVIGFIYVWCSGLLIAVGRRWQINRALKSARDRCNGILSDPHTSETQKKHATESLKKMERLESELIDSDIEQIHTSISTIGPENPRNSK